jgi:prefoldin subunit 5
LKFQLHDGMFVEGKVAKGNNSVALWLGSDIMVEYTYDEAIELLTANMKKAEYSVDTYVDFLAYLRTKISTFSRNRSLAVKSICPECTIIWSLSKRRPKLLAKHS